jgi:hypothetical protein
MCAIKILKTEWNNRLNLIGLSSTHSHFIALSDRIGLKTEAVSKILNDTRLSPFEKKPEILKIFQEVWPDVHPLKPRLPAKQTHLTTPKPATTALGIARLPNDLIGNIYSYIPCYERHRLALVSDLLNANHLRSYMNDLMSSPVFDYAMATRYTKPLKCTELDILKLQQNAVTHFRFYSYVVPPLSRSLPAHEVTVKTREFGRQVVSSIVAWVSMGDIAPIIGRITTLQVDCNCLPFADQDLMTILRNIPSLERLRIQGGVSVPSDETGRAIGEYCKELVELEIHGYKIRDDSVIAIAKGCQRLRKFHWQGYRPIHDVAIAALAEHSPRLIDLALNKSGFSSVLEISLSSMNHFVRSHPALERLSIGRCYSSVFDALVDSCPSLQEFSTEEVIDQTDWSHSLETLLLNCRQLKTLAIPFKGTSIDSPVASTLCKHGQPLKALTLYLPLHESFSVDAIRALKIFLPASDVFRAQHGYPMTSIFSPDIMEMEIDWNYVPHAKNAAWIRAYQNGLRNTQQFPSYQALRGVAQPFRDKVSFQLNKQEVKLFWNNIDFLETKINDESHCIFLAGRIMHSDIAKIPATLMFDALYLSGILQPSSTDPIGFPEEQRQVAV